MTKNVLYTFLIYIGEGGRHLTGIPARNLTAEDLERLDAKQVELCLASGLYIEGPDETKNPISVPGDSPVDETGGNDSFSEDETANNAPLED